MKCHAEKRMRLRCYVLFCLAIPSLWASNAWAQFDAGDVTISAGGSGGALGYGLSGTVGYFPVDRIEVSLGLGYWSMEDTGLVQVTPGARLIWRRFTSLCWDLYRRWYFQAMHTKIPQCRWSNGPFFQAAGGLFGLGVVSERLLDCPFENEDDCTSVYPEFSLASHLTSRVCL